MKTHESACLQLELLQCGLQITAQVDWQRELFEKLRFDFANLVVSAARAPFAELTIRPYRPPPRWRLPLFRFRQTRVSSDFVSRWVRYDARTWLQIERRENLRLTLFVDQIQSAHRHLYLLIHAILGEGLERRGYIRLHAFGLQLGASGIGIIGTSGTGKSTLALQALEHSSHRLYSDEIVLVRDGRLHAFPCRIARYPDEPSSSNPGKSLFELPANRVAQPSPMGLLLFASRVRAATTTASTPVAPRMATPTKIRSLSRSEKFIFLSQVTIGWHLPQLLEYCLRVDSLGFVAVMLLRRLRFAVRVLHADQVKRLIIFDRPQKKLSQSEFTALLASF